MDLYQVDRPNNKTSIMVAIIDTIKLAIAPFKPM